MQKTLLIILLICFNDVCYEANDKENVNKIMNEIEMEGWM